MIELQRAARLTLCMSHLRQEAEGNPPSLVIVQTFLDPHRLFDEREPVIEVTGGEQQHPLHGQ